MTDKQSEPRQVTEWDRDTAQMIVSIVNLDQSEGTEVLAEILADLREHQQSLGIFIDGAPVT